MRHKACLSLALLFLASVISSNAQSGAREEVLEVVAGAPLTVECALRVEQRAEWRLDGRAVPTDLRPAGEAPAAGASTRARLHAPAARAQHAGVYTCASGPGAQRVRVRLVARADNLAGTEPAAVEAARDGGGVHVAEDDGAIAVVFEVRGNLSLDCRPLVADAGAAREWIINATALEALPAAARARWTLSAAGDVLSAAGRAVEDDFGNFTCRAGGAERRWRVRARRHAKLGANTNVVEGQKLKLTCKLLGKPYAPVQWAYSNVSADHCNKSLVSGNTSSDSLDARVALGSERVTLRVSEQGVEDAELVLEPAARADAGWLCCAPAEPGSEAWPEAWRARASVTTLRVKDMYAALWPFLGICAEVFVLCAIILVYERRRTKPELDDSDTDNHDQKKS